MIELIEFYGFSVILAWVLWGAMVVALIASWIIGMLAKKRDDENLRKIKTLLRKICVALATVAFGLGLGGYGSVGVAEFYIFLVFAVISGVLLTVGIFLKKGSGVRIAGYAVSILAAIIFAFLDWQTVFTYLLAVIVFALAICAEIAKKAKKRLWSWMIGTFLLLFLSCVLVVMYGEGYAMEICIAVLSATVPVLISARLDITAYEEKLRSEQAETGGVSVAPLAYQNEILTVSLPVHILLIVVTAGIWQIVWVYQVTKYFNRFSSEAPQNAMASAWLSLLPLYYPYWLYKQALKAEEEIVVRGGKGSYLPIVCLICGLLAPALGFVLLQQKVRELLASE
ncbi:MAG: DUF4234 domain-containing protein [Clostridia bacterium]|nr:DUF4234 domain-containing protein [Clostridia bacterium]